MNKEIMCLFPSCYNQRLLPRTLITCRCNHLTIHSKENITFVYYLGFCPWDYNFTKGLVIQWISFSFIIILSVSQYHKYQCQTSYPHMSCAIYILVKVSSYFIKLLLVFDCTLLMDLPKAFDTLNHELLITKLKQRLA